MAQGDKRKALLNLVAGGDGTIKQWAEFVIYEATDAHPEYAGYLLHTNHYGSNNTELLINTDLETAQNICLMQDDGTEPLTIKKTCRRISAAEQARYHI